ncbi:MAG: lipid II flippase MurJ, partial [Candidatus Cloacimonadaceae bacterium]|nr:lipid II flippase MurJ [Candidatus Cloacimonadaceae bacterium]
MASFLPIGSITALGFGNRLMQLPLGIFAISAGTAVLPLYSRHITEKKFDELSENLHFASVSLACIVLPITMLIAILGKDFVYILFEHGIFDQRATLMTYQALFFYSLGLLFYSLNQTLTPLFYANKDTRTPVKIAAAMVALNIALNYILMQFIQHRGLALSTSITAVVNYCILLYMIHKKIPQVGFKRLFVNVLKAIIISLGLFVPLYYLNTLFANPDRWFLILKAGGISILYFSLFFILGMIFRIDYISTIRERLWSRLLRK